MEDLLETLQEIKQLLVEGLDLKRAQREINPLRAEGDNPIKKLVRDYRKAKRTKKPKDVSAAKNAHKVGEMYAQARGLPRLETQIKKHEKKIPKPKPEPKKLQKKSKDRTTAKSATSNSP